MLKFPLWKKVVVFIVLIWSVLYALPNFMTPEMRERVSFLPMRTLNLGLDLQGGAHLVLEVDINSVINRAYQNIEGSVRDTLRAEKQRYKGLNAHGTEEVAYEAFSPEDAETQAKTLRSKISDTYVNVDGTHVSLTLKPEVLSAKRQHALSQTLEILRSRVDEFGVSEPVIQRQGDDRIIIELPGVEDSARAKSVIGRTAQLTFHLVDESVSPSEAASGNLPLGSGIFYEERVTPETGQKVKIPYVLKKRPEITGDNLSGAQSTFDRYGQPAVTIRFDSRGTRKFAELTTKYVNHRMAIVLDGQVYSAPVLREPILGGSAEITGSFTVREAEDLSTVLRAGALPAKVEVVEERTVGPSLGQDSIEAGQKAVVLGFVFVLALMLVFYRGFGVAANMALFFNVALILSVMSFLGATLTMPGIAGIVLTIGMAVDANVLIFERIREETNRGKSPTVAIDSGFSSAFGTILDANITTIIAAAVMYGMGSGPIKGFALTLSVGILASMFTAVMVTRLMILTWLKKARPKTLTV
ncbi:MAG: protein translocase subunit SecD [Proteobacteria bacterium]|nr:protein translocase subunit SecD [Pseudomonadota bacterium]